MTRLLALVVTTLAIVGGTTESSAALGVADGPGDEPFLYCSPGHAGAMRDPAGPRTSNYRAHFPEFGMPNEEHPSQVLEERTLALTASYLRERLGPAWRIAAERSVGGRNDVVDLSLTGSLRTSPEVDALVHEAIRASHEQARATIIADTLPQGAERNQAEERAKAAAERAKAATEEIRIESHIIPVKHAVGEDVAKALKMALPWATFSAVGGTQVLASGTRQEITAALELSLQLDDAAAEQMLDAARRASDRSSQSPAGRLLSTPISIDFQGGSVTEYLALLSKTAGMESWVIEDPRVGGAYIPSIKLSSVTADSALRMLSGITIHSADQAMPVNVPLEVERIDPALTSDGLAMPIYRIRAIFPKTPPPSPARTREAAQAETRTEIFGVALPSDGEKEREAEINAAHGVLLAAIETGVGMQGASTGFKAKLHAPSAMLFVTGTHDELSLVRNIIQEWQSRN